MTAALQTANKSRINFSGSAGEYFKIWIVNVFLTIITAGIYGAWAKVRTRRYFYAATTLEGAPFDYLASPVNILKGHLIIAGAFICYTLTEQFKPEWAFLLMALFYLVFPFLAYKSLKFYTRYSAYRNIRFNFGGTLKQSYLIYLLHPLLIPLTLGLYLPYWSYLKKKWFFDNAGFGTAVNTFEGNPGAFYKAYIIALIQSVLIMVFFGLVIGVFAVSTGLFEGGVDDLVKKPEIFFIFTFSTYLGIIFLSVIPQQYLFARITNYCWNSSRMGSTLRIRADISPWKLILIRLTNIIAIVISLGLLFPWAKVRRTRYILSCMTVERETGFDAILAQDGAEVSALGDAAVDFFDFEIGL